MLMSSESLFFPFDHFLASFNNYYYNYILVVFRVFFFSYIFIFLVSYALALFNLLFNVFSLFTSSILVCVVLHQLKFFFVGVHPTAFSAKVRLYGYRGRAVIAKHSIVMSIPMLTLEQG